MSARGIALLTMAAAGCSMGQFEELRGRAWVDASGVPAGLTGSDYPIAIASLATDRPGLHLATIAASPPGLATISYDRAGVLAERGVALDVAPAGTRPTLVAATDAVVGADGAVVVGNLGTRNALLLYDARSGATGPLLRRVIEGSFCGLDLVDLGRHMVFTPTDAGTLADPDLIVTAGAELLLFTDLRPEVTPTCKRCTLAAGPIQSMVAADFDPGTDGDEIAIGVSGQIFVFHAGLIAFHSDIGAPCFEQNSPMVTYPAPASAGLDFGAVLAVGDANDIELPELAIAEPAAGKVYVVRDLGPTGPGPVATIIGQAASPSFAISMAHLDVDGDGFDELAIGDPGTSVDGVAVAGSVWLYKARESTSHEYELLSRLHDAQPEPDQGFGRVVIPAEFVGASDDTDLIVTATASELFTYFRVLATSVDPRE